ncbi:MAG: DUF1642 domain-containing protein [Lactococcus lactis]|nr:DUF1642 domain-containing protein [Lactococcus lactis]
MTKFEEKLEKLPIKNIEHPIGDTKYYAAVHVKTLIAQADEEIVNLKSRLQQQSLPVVPECVAEYIERCKSSDCGLIWAIRPDRDANDNSEEVYDWLFPNGVKLPNGMYPNPYEPDNLVRPDKENQIKFVRAWLDGYTVEKPQLFYLRDELTGQFLAKDNQFKNEDRYFFWTGADPLTHSIGTAWKLTYTQQEIDSMKTGSYELVPVEVQE